MERVSSLPFLRRRVNKVARIHAGAGRHRFLTSIKLTERLLVDSRVMIVDDNEYIRESVEILLQMNGTRSLNASGGKECLEYLQAGFRGVILMDVMMPFMDGWDTIREIVDRGLYDGNIIIMLTAMNEPGVKMEGLQQYVVDYITKPFIPHDFIDKLQCYLSFLDGAYENAG